MNNRRHVVAVAAVVLALSGTAGAVAQEAEKSPIPGTFSANVGITSEYFFRGLSQTDDKPALQGGFDYEVGVGGVTPYLGVWGSNVDFSGTESASVHGATLELDLYGGVKGDIPGTKLGWDAGVIWYTYPGASSSLNYDFVELQGALSYDLGFASLGASLNYSPDNFGESGTAWYPKLSVEVPIAKIVTLSGYVAKQWIEKNDVFGQPDYKEWGLGASVNVVGFDVAVNYKDTGISGSPDGADAAVFVTVSRSF